MTGEDFVKIFDTEYGKIVIMKDEADGPALVLYAVPDGFGTCNTKLVFKDDDWDALDTAYNAITKERAVEWFETAFNQW